MSKVRPTVIDLFCGCGGLSYGFIEAGYDVVLGIDHWQDAIKTFEHNHKGSKGLVADLFNETPKEISKRTGVKKADIIIGGPPCQGFSIAGIQSFPDIFIFLGSKTSQYEQVGNAVLEEIQF